MNALQVMQAPTHRVGMPVLNPCQSKAVICTATLAIGVFASLFLRVNGEKDLKDQQWTLLDGVSAKSVVGVLMGVSIVFVSILLVKKQSNHETRLGAAETTLDNHNKILADHDAQIARLIREVQALDGPRALAVQDFLKTAASSTSSTRTVYNHFRTYLNCFYTAFCAIYSKKVNPTTSDMITFLQTATDVLPAPTNLVRIAAFIAQAYNRWQQQQEAGRIVRLFLHETSNLDMTIKWIAAQATNELTQKIDIDLLLDEKGEAYLCDLVQAVINELIADSDRFNRILTRKIIGSCWTIGQIRGLQVSVSSRTPIPPEVAVFGKEQWKQYFGDVGEVPPLPESIYEKLDLDCSFLSGNTDKKRTENIRRCLILVPKKITFQSYAWSTEISVSSDNFSKIVRRKHNDSLREEEEYIPDIDWEDYQHRPVNLSVKESHWVLVDENVTLRSVSREKHHELLELYKRMTGIPYCIPSVIDALVCMVAMHCLSRDNEDGEIFTKNSVTCLWDLRKPASEPQKDSHRVHIKRMEQLMKPSVVLARTTV